MFNKIKGLTHFWKNYTYLRYVEDVVPLFGINLQMCQMFMRVIILYFYFNL